MPNKKSNKSSSNEAMTIENQSEIVEVDEEEVRGLAKRLASPQLDVREKYMKNLKSWLRKRERHVGRFSHQEMIKLWKGLFYCLWLADKVPVQLEIAHSLVSLMSEFKKFSNVSLFFKSFWETMIREWPLLDKYRLDKFYSLMRYMINSSYKMFVEHGQLEKWSTILRDEAMMKKPDGIRFHICDIAIDELFESGVADKLSAGDVQEVLSPFYCALGLSNSEVVGMYILRKVFHPLLDENREIPNIEFKSTGQALFAIAADSPDLTNKLREAIYDMRSLFKKAKHSRVVQPVEAKCNLETAFNEIVEETPSSISSTTPDSQKTKKTAIQEDVKNGSASKRSSPKTKSASKVVIEKEEVVPTVLTPSPVESKPSTSSRKKQKGDFREEAELILNSSSKKRKESVDNLAEAPVEGKKKKKLRFSLKDTQSLGHKTSIQRLRTTPVKPAASMAQPAQGLLRVKSPMSKTPKKTLKIGASLAAAEKNTLANVILTMKP